MTNNNLTCVISGFLKNWDLYDLIDEPFYRFCCINNFSIWPQNLKTCEKKVCSFEETEKQNSFQSFDY